MTSIEMETQLISPSKPKKYCLRLNKPTRKFLRKIIGCITFADFCIIIACAACFLIASMPPEKAKWGDIQICSPNRRSTPPPAAAISLGSKIAMFAITAFVLRGINDGRYKQIKQARRLAYISFFRYLMALFDLVMVLTGVMDIGEPSSMFGVLALVSLVCEAFVSIGFADLTFNIISDLDSYISTMEKYEEQKKFIHACFQPLVVPKCQCGSFRGPHSEGCLAASATPAPSPSSSD